MTLLRLGNTATGTVLWFNGVSLASDRVGDRMGGRVSPMLSSKDCYDNGYGHQMSGLNLECGTN
jgi:hypothetical protein